MTSYIGIKKYEIQNTVNVNGRVRISTFPTFFPKTDQTRIQYPSFVYYDLIINRFESMTQERNLPDHPTYYGDVDFEVTEKLEGTSITAYYHGGKFGMNSFVLFISSLWFPYSFYLLIIN